MTRSKSVITAQVQGKRGGVVAEGGGCRAKLTKRVLDRLEPTAGRYIVWDDDLIGFGVRVEPTGRKSFIARYRAGDAGRKAPLRQVTVGSYGKLTPDQARAEAKSILAAAELGSDPAQDRRERRQAKTVADLADHYLEDYAKSVGLRPSTVRDASGVLSRYALPRLGRMAVVEVSPADIRRTHMATADDGGRYQANRTLAYLSKLFSLAIEGGLRQDNPCRGIKKLPEDRRERVLSEAEVTRFFAALADYPDQGAADALRLLLFTGSRLNEVLKATWREFDLAAGVWSKPSAHTKQKRVHRLELDGPAIELLRARRAQDPLGQFLFPGRSREAPRADLSRPWRWLKVRADLKEVKLHDLRHTLASYMVSSGVPLAVIGRALGHTQAATTARYAHVADSSQRQAVNAVGKLFAELGSRPSADVILIPGSHRS